jgi:hypothetical protein
MTKGTGMCTARNQGNENFLTPARQKPNGRFRSKTERATIHKSFITLIVGQLFQMAFKTGFISQKDGLILELSISGIALHSLNVQKFLHTGRENVSLLWYNFNGVLPKKK